jgi:hypothetical protein
MSQVRAIQPIKKRSNVRLKEASKDEAKTLTKTVQTKVKAIERGWWSLAKLVDTCLKRHVPAALGMNAHTWLHTYMEGSLSDAFRKLRIVRALAGVPEQKIVAMKERNAYELCRLPEKERKSAEWVNKATRLPVEEFKEEVAHVLEKKGITREPMTDFYVRLTQSAHDNVVEPAMQKAARLLSIDLEQKPQLLVEVFEKICLFVLTTEDERFLIETEGGKHQEVSANG